MVPHASDDPTRAALSPVGLITGCVGRAHRHQLSLLSGIRRNRRSLRGFAFKPQLATLAAVC
jgi:hypothetical protein